MRALIVEDDPDIRKDLVEALGHAGFNVDAAGDGETAWFQGDVESYDVAVLDLGLPRLDGLTVRGDVTFAANTTTVDQTVGGTTWTVQVGDRPDVRSYSTVGPCTDGTYRIAVKRDDAGRGGSRYMHETLRAGDTLSISAPRNNFHLHEEAQYSVLVAGGMDEIVAQLTEVPPVVV